MTTQNTKKPSWMKLPKGSIAANAAKLATRHRSSPNVNNTSIIGSDGKVLPTVKKLSKLPKAGTPAGDAARRAIASQNETLVNQQNEHDSQRNTLDRINAHLDAKSSQKKK